MTDTSDHIVIPYARFLECRERRRLIEGAAPEPPTTDADVPPAPVDPPDPITTVWRTS